MGRVPTPPVPPPADLLKLALAALSNARDLLADAQLLVDADSFPRAHALATFANEEQSKAALCAAAAVLHPLGLDPAVFWDEFKTHKRKLHRAESITGLILRPTPESARQFIQQLPQAAADAHLRRLRSLYVDYRDGALLLPGDVTEPEARDLIDDVQRSINGAAMMCDMIGLLDDMRPLVAAMPDATLLAGLLNEMTETFQAAGPDLSVAALRQYWEYLNARRPSADELSTASAMPAADRDAAIAAGGDAAIAGFRTVLEHLSKVPPGSTGSTQADSPRGNEMPRG